jgi:hypothetical protein
MVLVATCFYIHEDHVLLQLYKNPLHYLRCTWHRFTKDRLLHPAFLLYLPSILPKSLFLTSLRSLGMHQRWLHGLQPTLSLPRLTCLTPYLPQNLSLPLFTVPSFLFSTHPLLPATHTHSCNNLKKKTLLTYLHTALFCITVLSVHRQSFHSSNNACSPLGTHFHSRSHMWHGYTFIWSPDQDLNIDQWQDPCLANVSSGYDPQ